MPRVTLSYRRDDSAGIARLIFERLKPRYGGDSVFMDIDAIEFGEDYRDKIHQALGQTDFLLVLIGPRWLGPTPSGRNRINDATDPVRMEVERALEVGLRVVPILLENTPMPSPAELPESLGRLSYLNAAEVSAGREFDSQIDRIIRFIDRTFAILEAKRARAQKGATEAGPAAPPPEPVPAPVPSPAPAPLPSPVPVVARRSSAPLIIGLAIVLSLGGLVALVSAIGHSGGARTASTSEPTAAPTVVAFPFPIATPAPTVAPTAVPTAVSTFDVFKKSGAPMAARAGATIPAGFHVMYPSLAGLFWKPTACTQNGAGAKVVIQLLNDYRTTFNADVALALPEDKFVATDWVEARQHLKPGLSPTYSRTFSKFTCGSGVSSGVRRVRFGSDSGAYVSF
jgi:hypothetical protein